MDNENGQDFTDITNSSNNIDISLETNETAMMINEFAIFINRTLCRDSVEMTPSSDLIAKGRRKWTYGENGGSGAWPLLHRSERRIHALA